MNSRRPRRVLVAAIVAALVAFAPGMAHAHTEFDFSLPAGGESAEAPLDEIIVAFTLPVTVVGNGFEVLTPAGEIVEPAVSTDDDVEFKLTLDPPLSGGDVGVRYEVRAEDGHVLADGFAFTVGDAPAETTVPATVPSTTAVPTIASPTTESSATAAPATTSPASQPGATGTTAPAETPAPTATPDETTGDEASTTTISASDGSDDGGSSAVIWVAIGVIVVGAGAFMFARARRSS